MKFLCEKSILGPAVAMVLRAAAQRSSIAALEGIHIRAGQELRLTGYNLEIGITVTAPADVLEPGECVMPARLFSEVIKNLPDGWVNVGVEGDLQATIACGKSSTKFATMDAEDYPELPTEDYEDSITLPQRALKGLISGTIFATAAVSTRPAQTGCLFEVEETSVTTVASDGYRLAMRRFRPEEPTGKELRFVAPAAALKEVQKLLADTDEPVKLTVGPRQILFEIGDAALFCRVIEGEFIISLTIDAARVAACVNFVGLMVPKAPIGPVRCEFGENWVDFRTKTQTGTAHDGCQMTGDGGNLEIGFNYRYLLDALHAVPDKTVALEPSNNVGPALLTPADGNDGYLYMVLPVRIGNGR